jgi:hypothetical protein
MELLGLLGPFSIGVMLIVVGALSRRLGRVTQAGPYYVGFFAAAGFVAVGITARLIHLSGGVLGINLEENLLWLLIYDVSLAAGVTLGLVIAWRYWSWLLAERD